MTKKLLAVLLAFSAALSMMAGCSQNIPSSPENSGSSSQTEQSSIGSSYSDFTLDDVPEYSGRPYAEINGNMPFFTKNELTDESFESYSQLDELGRCGAAYANVGQDLMPTEDRGNISQVKPSGWHSVRYDCVDGKSLYNRCHLIGFQLTGENANRGNLITGTRYMNVQGMLPFENMIADYVTETDNHVLYRVTPMFAGDNLVADGVLMEAYSVEDEGDGVCFCVFAYNVQPHIEIDYATGDSRLIEDSSSSNKKTTYILNTNSKKFHRPDCPSVDSMKKENRREYKGTREELIADGYTPCNSCNP